jgi:hypothetical protein
MPTAPNCPAAGFWVTVIAPVLLMPPPTLPAPTSLMPKAVFPFGMPAIVPVLVTAPWTVPPGPRI